METVGIERVSLYQVFVDLTKAFDTVSRSALWIILGKLGCPPLWSLGGEPLGTSFRGESTENLMLGFYECQKWKEQVKVSIFRKFKGLNIGNCEIGEVFKN